MTESALELIFKPLSGVQPNKSYHRSSTREIIPDHASIIKDKTVVKRSSQLLDIGLNGWMWEAYRVNALYGFDYSKLRSYAKDLTGQIRKIVHEIADFPDKHTEFCVKIENFADMDFASNDGHPLQITVTKKDDHEEQRSQIEYFKGILISVERKSGLYEAEKLAVNAVILPLFLVKYTNKHFLNTVKQFLENKFSCLVSPLKFSSANLLFILFLFSSPGSDESMNSTVIQYEGKDKELESITYAIDPKTINKVWKRVAKCSETTYEVSEFEAFKFLSIFEQRFYKLFSIHLSPFDLKCIKTPLAEVSTNSIRMTKNLKIYYVMKHLTHLAQELF